jgi:hypothetical protein
MLVAISRAESPGLVNGDFSQPLAAGWKAESQDFVGYHQVDNLKDGGVRVRKTMCGFARMKQDIELENTNTEFSTRANFTAMANRFGFHAYSALALGYLDKDGNVLGETRFYTISGQKGKPSSGSYRFVPVEPGKWMDLSLNIREEIRAHLPEVIPARVTGLRVTFEAFGSGTSSC